MIDDPFHAVCELPDLTTRTFKTPGAGASARPFKVGGTSPDSVVVRTFRGGRVTLRLEAFETAVKLIGDLGEADPEGWVRVSDETLQAVLRGENREKACASYLLPLLEAAGRVELARTRPGKVRLVPSRS